MTLQGIAIKKLLFLLLTTSQIISSLNLTRTRRTMTELKATGLVDMINSNAPGEDKIVLTKELSWFLTEEFNNLRPTPPTL
ncbi:MAG: hypothetical protein WAZ77_09750 [Candidatus Nitrosopolaris sp.]